MPEYEVVDKDLRNLSVSKQCRTQHSSFRFINIR